jgi:hypothetical protein
MFVTQLRVYPGGSLLVLAAIVGQRKQCLFFDKRTILLQNVVYSQLLKTHAYTKIDR